MNVSFWNMRPTVLSQMAIQYGPEAPWNDSYWKNERFGKLLKLAQAELDASRRHEMMCEMQTLIHNGSGMVTPAFSNNVDGLANNVMGVPQVPLGPLGALEWPESAWLA
jgi:peptide/nickel transport system substrate-binding protein